MLNCSFVRKPLCFILYQNNEMCLFPACIHSVTSPVAASKAPASTFGERSMTHMKYSEIGHSNQLLPLVPERASIPAYPMTHFFPGSSRMIQFERLYEDNRENATEQAEVPETHRNKSSSRLPWPANRADTMHRSQIQTQTVQQNYMY